MRTSETIRLPQVHGIEFDPSDEQLMRTTVEQTFQDLRGDVVDVRDKTDKAASLALRRHQFLLMGG